ncbi:MAG: hypothetical protein JWP97_963 [Labilithrix sp.]|nr:hypothetical protein [Labilithrix sp.]
MVAAVATSANASAFEVKHAESGELVRWHAASVSMVVDRSVDHVRGAGDALTDAAEAWSHVGGAPRVTIDERRVTRSPGYDGTNAVFYDADGFVTSSGEALAVTVLSFDSATGSVLDADIVLNGKYKLGVVGDHGSDAQTYDVRRVIAHEMGHALGLSDELTLDAESALMYPYVPRDKVLAVTPASDDVAGLEALYAEAPALDAAPAAQAQASAGCQVGSGPDRSGVAVIAASAAALFVLASRRRAKRAVREGLATVALIVAPFAVGGDVPVDVEADLTPGALPLAGTVTDVSTTSDRGLFRSVVEICDAGACSRVLVRGGSLGGVTQMIGGTRVPRIGERIRLAARTRMVLP